MPQGFVVIYGMADKKLPNINWIATGAIATVVIAIATIGGYFWGSPIPIINSPVINSPADPPALTATIESFRYRHAETGILGRREELHEEWLQPFKGKLKAHGIAPELIETVIAAMEDMIKERIEREFLMAESASRVLKSGTL